MKEYLSTGAIAKRCGVSRDTVSDWMVRGLVLAGRQHRLQYLRMGIRRKTTQEWLDQFLTGINQDCPPIHETKQQFSARAVRAESMARQLLKGE